MRSWTKSYDQTWFGRSGLRRTLPVGGFLVKLAYFRIDPVVQFEKQAIDIPQEGGPAANGNHHQGQNSEGGKDQIIVDAGEPGERSGQRRAQQLAKHHDGDQARDNVLRQEPNETQPVD